MTAHSRMQDGHHKPRAGRAHRFLILLYWGGAAFLAPWIVALYIEQPKTGVAYHLRAVTLGISLITVAGMFVTGLACHRRSQFAVLSATFTGTLVFITAWFNLVTTSGADFDTAVVHSLAFQLPIVVLCAWTVHRLRHPGRRHERLPAWAPYVYGVGALLLLAVAVILSHSLTPTRAAYHLRLVWTGLDIFELAGMIATGWCLLRRSSALAIAATFTGTLLFADAWFNVVATTGSVQLAGIAMAFAELPLAALSLVVAYREIRSEPRAERASSGVQSSPA